MSHCWVSPVNTCPFKHQFSSTSTEVGGKFEEATAQKEVEAKKAAERMMALLVLTTRQLGTKCGQVVLILRTKLQRERQRESRKRR